LPLALLSPITSTSSLTDTPINSGGISLLTEAAAAEAAEATFDLVGLCEPGLFMASPLNHFWKKLGFGEGVRFLARDSRLGEAVGI